MDGRKRARATDSHDLEQCGSHEPVLPPTGRPTTLERAVGCDIVIGMQNADCKPPLLQAGAGKPEVAALSLALYFGQKFGGDRASKRLFNVGNGTDVKAWVDDKLPRFFDSDPQAKELGSPLGTWAILGGVNGPSLVYAANRIFVEFLTVASGTYQNDVICVETGE